MNTDIAIRTVRSALELYGFEKGARIELVKYRENYVFRLSSGPTDSYAVRLHRPGHRSDAEIRTELAYLHALRDLGVEVPEIVPTVNGDLLCSVSDGAGATFQLDVQKWLERAQPLGDVVEALAGTSSLDPEAFRRIGALTAELHNQTSAIGRLPGFQRAAWDADGLFGQDALWGNPLALEGLGPDDSGLLKSVIARLKRDFEAMDTPPESYGVIHADLTPENILVQDGRMIIIDFDDFGEGWHLFDLATILFFYQLDPQFDAYFAALIEGYKSVRPLPRDFLEPWNAMLLARGLSYLAWAAERRGDEAAEFIVDRVVPVVLGLASRYTRRGHLPGGH